MSIMSSCIFLLPNALLSSSEKGLVNAVLSSDLAKFLERAEQYRSFNLCSDPCFKGYASIQWIWLLLTQQKIVAPYAPYFWKGLGGPKINRYIWMLDPYIIKDHRLMPAEIAGFDLEEECELRDSLMPICSPRGFDIQVLNGRFFLSQKAQWELLVVPWAIQKGKMASNVIGPNLAEYNDFCQEINRAVRESGINRYRLDKAKTLIDGLWLSGGQKEQTFSTDIRCVLNPSPFVDGVAQACGISKNHILRDTSSWPECPEGDKLAIFNDFCLPELRKDPEKLHLAWNKVIVNIEKLTEQAQTQMPHTIKIVLSNEDTISIIE